VYVTTCKLATPKRTGKDQFVLIIEIFFDVSEEGKAMFKIIVSLRSNTLRI